MSRSKMDGDTKKPDTVGIVGPPPPLYTSELTGGERKGGGGGNNGTATRGGEGAPRHFAPTSLGLYGAPTVPRRHVAPTPPDMSWLFDRSGPGLPEPPPPREVDRIVEAAQLGRWAELERMFADRLLTNANYKDAEDCSILHWAAINDHVDVCRELLNRGAQVSIIGGVLVSTPLHWAARVGATRAAALLISRGADTRLRDAHGSCPIHVAVQNAHTPLVAYMIARDPHCLNLTDNSGMTPTMWAASKIFGMFPLRLLVRAGADVNARENEQGDTALHLAVRQYNYSAIEQLLGADSIDLEVRNRAQKSAMDMARDSRDRRILERLERERERHRRGRASADVRRPSPTASIVEKARYLWRRASNDERTSQALHFAAPGLLLGFLALFMSLSVHFIFPLLLILFIAAVFMTAGSPHLCRAMSGRSLTPLGINMAEAVVFSIGWWPWFTASAPWWLHVLFAVTAATYWTTVVRLIRYSAHKVPLVEDGRITVRNFCFSCFSDKPLDTHHCRYCNRCVRDFDHHCPWIANCVSRQNQRTFLLFVSSVVMLSVLVFGAFVHRCLTDERSWLQLLDAWRFLWFATALSVVHMAWAGMLLWTQLQHIVNHTTTYEAIKNARSGFQVLMLQSGGGGGGGSSDDGSKFA